jgi:tetratricopeptide (TPR) repeat protein
MWADNYERALIEVFAVQADIAEKIVEQLGLTLVDKDRRNLASRPTDNPEAYQYYLKALKAIREASDYSGSITAQAATDSAVALDPAFALAHALRSEAHSNGAWNAPESKRGKLALEAARRSLELQPGLPQGYLALGNYYHRVESDYNRALEEFAKAKAELRNDPELLEAIAFVQSRQGKYEKSLGNRSKAAELDPLNARRHANLAGVLQNLRRFPEAEESINRAIALEPEFQTYYEDKIDCVIARYGEIEMVRPVVSAALAHCDTMLFILKNSSVTRYIPELQTDSVIAHYVRMRRADKSKRHFFGDLPFWYMQHMDILENYETEAKGMVKDYDGSDKFVDWYGLLFSFLGDCDQAIRLGLRGKELMSIDECVSCMPLRLMTLARIYANCGLYDEAIDELEAVLSLETYVTVNTLKLKHWIDPFRDDPRFQSLTRKYE